MDTLKSIKDMCESIPKIFEHAKQEAYNAGVSDGINKSITWSSTGYKGYTKYLLTINNYTTNYQYDNPETEFCYSYVAIGKYLPELKRWLVDGELLETQPDILSDDDEIEPGDYVAYFAELPKPYKA